MVKKTYRVRNWSDYNKALKRRGSITFWINEASTQHWYAEKDNRRGRPKVYADEAIEMCLVMRMLFHLPLRQCEGFVENIFKMLNLKLNVPSYTQLCRRQKTLRLKLKHPIDITRPIHVVIDATGLKLFGEGEWKVRQHGYTKHRMWRKFHAGIDVDTKQFVMMELTDNHVGENKKLHHLLSQYSGPISRVGADKGYDSYECHEIVGALGAESAILLQRRAKIRRRVKAGEIPLVRDNIVRRMRAVGRIQWKAEVQYHKRSLIENAFLRYKKLFGGKLRAISLENQKIETLIGCNILNTFSEMGMPISESV